MLHDLQEKSFTQQTQKDYLTKMNEIIAEMLFLISISVYMLLEDYPQIFPCIQSCFACFSVIVLIINDFDRRCLGHVLIVLATISLSMLHGQWRRLYMAIPILYFVDCPSIQRKLLIILNVMGQSLWLLISLSVCYYFFGGIAYKIFSNDNPFFVDEKFASLTFLQLSTLDSIGQVASRSSNDRGFALTFFVIIGVLFITHGLLNINMAFILSYISDEYKEHRTLLDINHDLISSDIPLLHRLIRLANIISSVWIIFWPYNVAFAEFYMITSLISTMLLMLSEHLQEASSWIQPIVNITLIVIVMFYYITTSYTALFTVAITRIVLIPQIKYLFKKVYRSLKMGSPFVLFTISCFVTFSFIMYTINRRTPNLKSIYQEFIETLQISCLDDYATILRRNNWLVGLMIIFYIVFFNHLLMNILIAQLFNALAVEDINKKVMKSLAPNQPINIKDNEPDMEVQPEIVNTTHYTQMFVELVIELGYKPKT